MISQIFVDISEWFVSVGVYLFEHYEIVTGIVLLLFAVGLLCQMIVNSLMEEDIIELCERIEELETAVGLEEWDEDDGGNGERKYVFKRGDVSISVGIKNDDGNGERNGDSQTDKETSLLGQMIVNSLLEAVQTDKELEEKRQ